MLSKIIGLLFKTETGFPCECGGVAGGVLMENTNAIPYSISCNNCGFKIMSSSPNISILKQSWDIAMNDIVYAEYQKNIK